MRLTGRCSESKHASCTESADATAPALRRRCRLPPPLLPCSTVCCKKACRGVPPPLPMPQKSHTCRRSLSCHRCPPDLGSVAAGAAAHRHKARSTQPGGPPAYSPSLDTLSSSRRPATSAGTWCSGELCIPRAAPEAGAHLLAGRALVQLQYHSPTAALPHHLRHRSARYTAAWSQNTVQEQRNHSTWRAWHGAGRSGIQTLLSVTSPPHRRWPPAAAGAPGGPHAAAGRPPLALAVNRTLLKRDRSAPVGSGGGVGWGGVSGGVVMSASERTRARGREHGGQLKAVPGPRSSAAATARSALWQRLTAAVGAGQVEVDLRGRGRRRGRCGLAGAGVQRMTRQHATAQQQQQQQHQARSRLRHGAFKTSGGAPIPPWK